VNAARAMETATARAKELSGIAVSDMDDWLAIDDETDVNLWSDARGVLHATAYPVVGGQTKTGPAHMVGLF
jgi:hypothetical protein